HHTAPVLHLYALHEALREIELEGAEARYERHADVGAYFQQAVRDRGYDFLADPAYQLGQLSAMLVPEGVDGKDVQVRLLREHGIEVGGGLGPDFPSIWRIGLMGTNATRDVADRLLAAYEDVLGSSA
ncbi:MAG: alanine--glyoxylate aminotransferase family protein, partial [Gaiellales bacterium]